MKNFKFTEVATAVDATTLAVVGKMALEGKNADIKNMMNGEEVSFEVEETDTYGSMKTVIKAFSLIDGLNLITITLPITDNKTVSEHIKKCVNGAFEEGTTWYNVDIESVYNDTIVFVRDADTGRNKAKTITLELVLPSDTSDDFMRDIRRTVHKSFKGMDDYVESNVIVYSSPTVEDDLTQVGVNIDCGSVKDKIGVFSKTVRFVGDTLEKFFNDENNFGEEDQCLMEKINE